MVGLEYRRFVLTLANEVAAAHREHGQNINAAEARAIDEIAATLGAEASRVRDVRPV